MEELGPILIVGIVIVIIWYWRTHVAFKTTKDNPQPDHDKSSAKQQPRIEQVAMQPSQPTPDLDQILNGIMDQLLQLTGAERGYISLRGPEANAAEVRVARNVEPQQTEMKIVEHVFESKQLLVTTNAAEDSRFSSQESVVSYALRSMMAVPLEIEGEVLGVMYVDKRVKAGLFSNNDMEPISQLAKQAAMLIRTKQVEVSSQSSADAIPALSVSTAVTPATIEQPTVPSLAAPESKPETDSPALSTSPVDKQAKSGGSLLRRIERGNQQGASKEKPLDSEEQSRLNAMRQQRRLQMPVVGQASSTSASGYAELRDRVKTKLLSELDSSLDMHSSDSRSTIEELFNAILAEENIVLSRAEKARLYEQIVAERLGEFASAEVKPPIPTESVRFTAYYPKEAASETWYTLLVYAHIEEAIQKVQTDAAHFKPEMGSIPKEAKASALAQLARGTEITMVPQAEGVAFNPERISFKWVEDMHRADFRMRASKDLVDSAATGTITIYVGPLIIATIKIAMLIQSEIADPKTDAQDIASTNVYKQEQIFVSYSHADTEIVKQCRHAYRALGYSVLMDIDNLRSGEQWNQALMNMIDRADIFQLLWSQNSATSKYVEQEWKYALQKSKDKGEGFVRPVYWEQPLPPPPPDLDPLHFAYIPLKSE